MIWCRRGIRALALLAILLSAAHPAAAEGPRHGLSVFGDLKYPEGFAHFDYVNPDAPKGGKISLIGTAGRTTFDSFNNFILKGDPAQGLELLFDSLMTRAYDEPDAVYGLVASKAEVAADGMSVVFHLRPEAKFSDGSPVTAEDVIFSFETLKDKGLPNISIPLKDVTKAEAIENGTAVRYTFQGDLVRDLPLIVAELPILSKAFYTTQPFDATSLTPPLGSGPYAISDYKPGTFVAYKRRPGYWAAGLNVSKGRFNFDEIRYDYFRDRTIELQNLFNGTFDWREEFTSLHWATGYDKQPVKDGRIVRMTLPDERPSGTQGFFINTRREKFKDIRVRKALDLAFDFEWSNRNLFFGLYKRTQSYFENSPMKATGKPSPEELALLEPYRDKLPAAVFEEPYRPPVTDGSGNIRDNLMKARELLAEAGWKVETETVADPDCGFFCTALRTVGLSSAPTAAVARNARGEPLEVEFLIFEDGFERIIGPYVNTLRKLGVLASIRRVDPAEHERRLESFDFDISIQRYALRSTPGVELRAYWDSRAAGVPGTQNLAGIADPVADAMIDRIIAAKSRADLETAARALDRVLLAGHYWVSHWYKAAHNIAFWNKFSWPENHPRYSDGVVDTWWYDEAKAGKLTEARTP